MFRSALVPVALLAARVAAQTSTLCNPLKESCPEDPALGTTYDVTFNPSMTELDPKLWNVTAGAQNLKFGNDGAELVITKSGDSVTAETNFYIFWGSVEVIMQAAVGTGIISTFDILSDDLDEIDLEIMGGNHTSVETNWYGWGNTSQYNSKYYPVDGPQERMHNYTFVWDKSQIEWIIDNSTVRTLPYAAPEQYPQTPSKLKFGIWAGGDSTQPEGTITWAGGKTDWSKGPFTMTVQSIKITDGSTNTTSYSYKDRSGSYQSINATPGESASYKELHKESTTENIQSHWNGLSKNAKIGIACGVVGGFALFVVAFTAFCCVQRKRGREEARKLDKEWDDQQNELMEYRSQMAKGQFAVSQMGHGERF